MSTSAPDGLRERKRRRTRDEIQARALDLFVAQGYRSTTMEQVAAAADVSARTVYRYFPTKDALVVTDSDDDRLIEAFEAELASGGAIASFRRALTIVFTDLQSGTEESSAHRRVLIGAEPELAAALLRQVQGMAVRCAQVLVERTGRQADADEALQLAGAVMGIALVTLGVGVPGSPGGPLDEQIDRLRTALDHLEHGFSF